MHLMLRAFFCRFGLKVTCLQYYISCDFSQPHMIIKKLSSLKVPCSVSYLESFANFPFSEININHGCFFAPPPSRGGAITPSLLRRACTRDGAGRCDGQKGIVDVAVVDQLKARTRKCRLDKGSHLPGNPVQSLWNINNQSMYKYMLNG